VSDAAVVERLRIASRGSALALRQVELVLGRVRVEHPGLEVEVLTVRTTGDRNQTAPLQTLGDGVFVRGVEQELLEGRADVAVHSAKDMPSADTPGLVVAAYPERADARDVLVSIEPGTFLDLPPGSRLGTGSPRREAIARALRPDLEVLPVRGNVDTRLRKLLDGGYDALVLAAAGLERLGLGNHIVERLDPDTWVPAAGQGALAVQCRAGSPAEALLETLDHAPTRAAVTAERAVLRRLGTGCRTPVAAHGRMVDGVLRLRGVLAAPDGSAMVVDEVRGAPSDAEQLGTTLADALRAAAWFFEAAP
jgi:hydroxymethylbilane synthase